jgi:hypothetical protein
MSYGVVEYDQSGKPICELCGRSFDRLMSHVRQVHGMTARAYKKKYGLDLKKGICSRSSSKKSRDRVRDNYDKVVGKNLIERGTSTRFESGSNKGRTKDMVSEETRIRLRNRLKSDPMTGILKELGRKLGKSGKGNAARWGKNEN